MKNLFCCVVFLLFACYNVKAQVLDSAAGKPGSPIKVRCVPSRGQLVNPPLYIVVSHKKEFKIDSLNTINPKSIKNINIFKDAASLHTYGPDARYGLILIMINDKKHPEVYKQLKKTAVRFKRPSE
jgi:hypothetical protein